ncbi:conserved hypothetical protein [Ricinus communis]|uniref:Uncharacterized protein n=1 Tax=Ricinus communis TaxID=3988 RepID=B9TNH3_RICCO|nr:conserved hypothetical protein [Ricinus communis]
MPDRILLAMKRRVRPQLIVGLQLERIDKIGMAGGGNGLHGPDGLAGGEPRLRETDRPACILSKRMKQAMPPVMGVEEAQEHGRQIIEHVGRGFRQEAMAVASLPIRFAQPLASRQDMVRVDGKAGVRRQPLTLDGDPIGPQMSHLDGIDRDARLPRGSDRRLMIGALFTVNDQIGDAAFRDQPPDIALPGSERTAIVDGAAPSPEDRIAGI